MTQPPDFLGEDELDTFEGFLRFRAVDPKTATAEELAVFRKLFDDSTINKAATPKMGALKFKPTAGELRYAVAVREGQDLWLTTWVRRAPEGDVYVLIPRNDGSWNPHTSYHRDGTFHMKSHDHKMLTSKKQPLTPAFRGAEHLGTNAGHGPKAVGAICDPADFSGIVEVAPGILGPRDGFVAVDLIEPGHEHEVLDLFNPVLETHVFKETVPWLVIRIGRQAPLVPG